MPKKNKIATQQTNKDIIQEFEELQKQGALAVIGTEQLLQKALTSKDPETLLKANTLFSKYYGQQEKGLPTKSYFMDPYMMSQSMGFKDKLTGVTYDTLRRMAISPIIKAIITTRVEQVAACSQYQEDDQKLGWKIRKRKSKKDEQLNNEDKKTIEEIAEFIQSGGCLGDVWSTDDFDKFLRKFTNDSLTLDQATFEVRRDRADRLIDFIVTDGATYRLAMNKEKTEDNVVIKNNIEYYPSYVQILNQVIYAEFYPWELCFGIRNPETSIRKNGYGRSELEDMIKIVTWMLYGDSYNGNFFSQGAAPKGILKLSGNINESRLAEFRQQWQAQVAGVKNSWKTPVIEADKMEFVNMQMSNQDMQFAHWQEYLIKLTCALYKMDPSEIGFQMNGTNSSLFEGDKQYKLEFSQEKGLKPLLRFIAANINKYLVRQINKDFEFTWTGLDVENQDKVLDADIKKLGNFMGFKEIRKKYGLPEDLNEEDMISNGIYYQWKISQAQQQQMEGDTNTTDEVNNEPMNEEEQTTEESNPFENEENNPFLKSFNKWIDVLIHEDK